MNLGFSYFTQSYFRTNNILIVGDFSISNYLFQSH